jgi:hypothetical protein
MEVIMFRIARVCCLLLFVSVALFAKGPFGQNLFLNGEQQYFEVLDTSCPDLAKTNVITVEMWFKSASAHAYNLVNKWKYYPATNVNDVMYGFKGHGWLLDFNRHSTANRGKLELRYRDPLDAFFAADFLRTVRANVKDDGGWGCSSSGTLKKLSANNWHHIAFVLNGPSQYVYMDGVVAQSGTSSKKDNTSAGTSLNIGGFAEEIAATLENSSYFSGTIDEVRIWKVARTAMQIKSTMNDTLSPTVYNSAESGLIGYYRFDELENLSVGEDGLVNDVRDLSASQNHGNVWNDAQLSGPSLQSKIDQNVKTPVEFNLYQNYPNPFNPTTTIKFDLAVASPVNIKIYDIQGRLVSTIFDTQMDAGPAQP